MSSPFTGLLIGLSALQAQRQAMEVAGQNVANANTPGYSRQRVELSAKPTFWTPTLEGSPPGTQMGIGVDVQTIRRIGMGLLARQLRNETATLRYWEAYRDGVTRIEGTFQALAGSSLGDALDAFWAAWRDLAAAPQEMAMRLAVVERGQQVAVQLNQLYDRLEALQGSLNDQVANLVEEINAKATEVADLNRQIRIALAMGQQPNELLDRRDLLVRELVETTGASVVDNGDGTVTLSLGTRALVDGTDANELTAVDPGTGLYVVRWAADNSDADVEGGKLRGLLDVRDTLIPDQLTALDELAVALRDGINAVHSAGYGLDGTTGLAFFQGAGASDLAVNSTLVNDPRQVAAASISNAPGDGSNALALAGVADERLLAGATTTIGEFYRELVTRLGLQVEEAEDQVNGQEAVVTFLENQGQAIAGVSLDEEAVHLIEAQRAYQAAARVITSVDQMLDRLINGTGVVGR